MSKIFKTDSLECFDQYKSAFQEYSISYPQELEIYIWDSPSSFIDMYFTSDSLISREGSSENFLHTINSNAFAGLACFPQSINISSIDKNIMASSIAQSLNSSKEDSNINYTYSIYSNTENWDIVKNKAVSYLSQFPIININENINNGYRSSLHIHFCLEQNVILFALSCEGRNAFAIDKEELINLLCDSFQKLEGGLN